MKCVWPSSDLVLLDELREHHSWEAWHAITVSDIPSSSTCGIGISRTVQPTGPASQVLRPAEPEACSDFPGRERARLIRTGSAAEWPTR